ncbi:hypothetical protein BJY00DRAFT_316569 [Aspergillus carlsbadensis]|nr:hypothetical protein BJY00DRAFT_316569 [Aspergillus carlsbadensis]
MDDEPDIYTGMLSRLAYYLPGYDQFSKHSSVKVQITLIDVLETGNVHVHNPQFWDASLTPRDLYGWLTQQADVTTMRYVVVEDLIPEICETLGATFDLDPQFFIDHLND